MEAINTTNLNREQKGKLIFEKGRIAKKNNYWVVGSQSSFRAYEVRNKIFESPDDFEFITVIEIEIPWLHFSTRNYIYENHNERFWLISRA